MAVQDRGQPDFGPLAALEPGTSGCRAGTDGFGACADCGIRRGGTESDVVPPGGDIAGGAAASGGAAVCGAEKHQGSGAGDPQDRGRGEAVAVPRVEQSAGAHG